MENENTTGREVATIGKPALPTFNLTPRSLQEAMDLAKLMSGSSLVPKQFQDKPGDILIAVQMGAEVGLSPMAAIQNIAVINGKPGFYGDVGKALLLAHGCAIEEADAEEIRKTNVARCTISRAGRPSVTRTFSVDDAKTAKLWGKDGPWTNYPLRQLAWRAFWFAARDAAADVLKGVAGAEELEDYAVREARNITPAAAPIEPPRKSERETQAQAAGTTAEPEKQERAAAAGGGAGSGGGNGGGSGPVDLNKVRTAIFKLMPRYNKAKGDGAAAALCERDYETSEISKLKPDEAVGFLKALEAELGVVGA